jgi:D-xylose transport system ATP-binding protein
MRGIVKDFPGVRALDHIDFSLLEGEIMTLIGENGAGKSTLLKVLSGVYPYGTYQGQILVRGQPVRFAGTRDAERAGIAIIHQELNLIPEMTVAENLFLGYEPRRGPLLDRPEMIRRSKELLAQLEMDIDPWVPVGRLGVGRQQMVEIARALRSQASILLLDEPSSALTEREVEILFQTVRRLKARGVTCVYISHHIDELFAIGDRCTVIRDGATVGVAPLSELTQEKIVAMMVGRQIDDIFPSRQVQAGPVVLEVRDFWVAHPLLPGEKIVQDVQFQLRAGEILGVAGLMGSGRTELLCGIFGVFPAETGGTLLLEGRPAHFRTSFEAISAGLALVPEDRKTLGLIPQMSVGANTTLAELGRLARLGVLDRLAEAAEMRRWVEELRIRTAGVHAPVSTLSGGNQQKVVLGRCLATSPRVLLVDEPTRGVDVGARTEIYRVLNQLLSQGKAILMVSSSLPEILGMADRVLVMREGRQVALLEARATSQEEIMQYATGARAPQPRV